MTCFDLALLGLLVIFIAVKCIKCFIQRNTISVMKDGKIRHFDLTKLSLEEIKELREILKR